MAALRCSICGSNWPVEPEYKHCPVCGEQCSFFVNAEPLDGGEATSLRLHAEFERFYEESRGIPASSD